MERISGEGFFSYRRDVNGKKDSRRAGRPTPVRTFFSDLREVQESGTPGGLDPDDSDSQAADLLDAVFEAGDRLKRSGDTATLMAYKAAVKRFLKAVVDRGMTVEEQTSGSNIMKRKRYTLVQVIDSKLEQLAAGMISSQLPQLDLLARVDEVNGLLIDLSH